MDMPPKGIARGPSVLLMGSEPILEKGEVKKERLLGNPAASRWHITDVVSPVVDIT